LPDKLAVAFLAKGPLNQPYFHGTLHNTATLCIQHDPVQPNAIPTRYGLEAFVQAIATQPGGEPDHAIAFVKRKDRWYRVNDAEVEEITELAAWEQAKNARVLFYRKEALAKRKDG
jgi:ubiquitin C-terminal hydrolase